MLQYRWAFSSIGSKVAGFLSANKSWEKEMGEAIDKNT